MGTENVLGGGRRSHKVCAGQVRTSCIIYQPFFTHLRSCSFVRGATTAGDRWQILYPISSLLIALQLPALPGAYPHVQARVAMRFVASRSPHSGPRKRAALCQGLVRRECRQERLPTTAERLAERRASVMSIVARPL
jgi:hypothetical protein